MMLKVEVRQPHCRVRVNNPMRDQQRAGTGVENARASPESVDIHAFPELGIGARCNNSSVGRSRGVLVRVEDGIAEADQRLLRLVLARERTQRLEARYRWQHAHGMALEQPSRVAIRGEIGRRIRRRYDSRLLRHKQMERKRRERARGHHDQMLFALDQRLDR